MSQIHQWLVKQGRIALSAEAPYLLMEIDGEGVDTCLIDPEDAFDIAQILTHHARLLWEASTRQSEPGPLLETLSDTAYRWKTSGGYLNVSLSPAATEIALSYSGQEPCALSVQQAVEIIQILQRLLERFE